MVTTFSDSEPFKGFNLILIQALPCELSNHVSKYTQGRKFKKKSVEETPLLKPKPPKSTLLGVYVNVLPH